MSILESMLEELCQTPEDWKLRGMLADCAEDSFAPEVAECLRWMSEHHKRPYHGKAAGATWFNADTISPDLNDPESDIPGPVYLLLEGGREVANHKSFPSLRAAEVSFQSAWVQARKRGWKPDA